MKRQYDFSRSERGRFFKPNAKISLPNLTEKADWVGPEGPLGDFIARETMKTLDSYRVQPRLLTEHSNQEHETAHGGYARRQLFELVQNSADALLDAPKGRSILIRLTKGFLYCADDGKPIDEEGVVGLMFDRLSSKRNTLAIGRFGKGFKSVLRVSDAPEFYSRSGSFSFDKTRSAKRIAEVAQAERYPVLRLPAPIDPYKVRDTDDEMQELMSWATNIVRLPLQSGAHDDLARQIADFPPEFLLFVDHVRYLTLENEEVSRSFILQHRHGEFCLDTGEGITRWRLFKTTHSLSAEARRDWALHEDSGYVPVSWAAPLDRLDRPGYFWSFFPTSTASLVAGILNAPWKTNEDRQNLLPGPYNKELIEAAARLIADGLPSLTTQADPARHLDALPRRQESGDSQQSVLLRNRLFFHLREREIVPDQKGKLCPATEIAYPPRELTEGSGSAHFMRWAEYPGRPSNWLHHEALTRNRLASIDRLFEPHWKGGVPTAPRATIAEWLGSLVRDQNEDEAIRASMAAIKVAAEIPDDVRSNHRLGDIVLTVSGGWRSPDPERLFLPHESEVGDGDEDPASCVHPKLASDRYTLAALKKLGIRPPSPERRFRLVAKRTLRSVRDQETRDELYHYFWIASRMLSTESACDVIREHKDTDGEIWPKKLRVRTRAGTWQFLHSVLFPGEIVPDDGSRDEGVTLDTRFHEPDFELLSILGVAEAPRGGRDLSLEPQFASFLSTWRQLYSKQDNLPHNPGKSYLSFVSSKGVGPLQVLVALSDEGNVLFTDALLNHSATFEHWTMRHTGTNWRSYPTVKCESFTIHMLRTHGRIRTSGGIVPLADALGPYPESPAALQELLAHCNADRIKETFDLAEPTPEFVGEDDPVPLADIWPGLGQYLPAHRRTCCLVRCERILVIGEPRDCVFHASNVYLSDSVGDDEQKKLQLVSNELELGLDTHQIDSILHRRTPKEIKERLAAIRRYSTDAERLLAAVGEEAIRKGLPDSLIAVLESYDLPLTGTDIAEAAIATWHTDVLRQYKWALYHLDPPSQWAGSQRAVDFVRSLGFSAEWAGERDRKRDAFFEVEGPYSLPKLHNYQRTIVNNVRDMLGSTHGNEFKRRGIVSMPTGSGKTRVAVQAIVEAMRDDGFRGGVLWVADRDELCEQAVEAWRQVWSSEGVQAMRLRISRMWGGLERPQPTSQLHVIVATIQTLNARLSSQTEDYKFLASFNLVVFDEAHRSIAPTFTTVMEDIGFTRFQRVEEPFMLGLTATPYRGRDEEETKRLVRRYGSRRLDSEAFVSDEPEAVIRQLQDMGVLAQADHETIEGESFPLDEILDGSLDKEELEGILEKWLALPWLPRSVENRIAQSAERTKRIIEAYESHIDPEWATLVFATSVEHAQTVAALLNRRGIRSRAVSGETEPATRRRVVEEFRGGYVRALVNYGVFREGFDAPKTRAIIVARPVYSPNLYFQMIGRGLRGPLNGGDHRCLILNVRDNIENFARKLAFSELNWLWA